MSKREDLVLEILADHYASECNCLTFNYLSTTTGLDRRVVRRTVRALARKGLAEYVRGLFNDEGMVAGSGYCCTRKGFEVRREGGRAA